MEEKKVSVMNTEGEKLIGFAILPFIQHEKYPAVILVHGYGATKEESGGMFTELARRLSKIGCVVFSFDFSGSGESEGDWSETSLSKLRDDLICILAYVRKQSYVDGEHIGMVGQSLGSSAIVALRPDVQCLVLVGVPAHMEDVYRKIFDTGYNPTGISTRVHSDGRVTKLQSQFWEDFKRHDLLAVIRLIHCPILFVHAGDDEKVPLAEMEAYFIQANPPKEKIVIAGGDHGWRIKREEMFNATVSWCKKYLV